MVISEWLAPFADRDSAALMAFVQNDMMRNFAIYFSAEKTNPFSVESGTGRSSISDREQMPVTI